MRPLDWNLSPPEPIVAAHVGHFTLMSNPMNDFEPSRRFVRSLAAVLGLFAALLIPGLALAQSPCQDLDPDAAAKYQALNEKMTKAYQAEQWSETIRSILEMREVCAEDPSLLYNLARAYHKAADCNKALFWYEKIQSLPDKAGYSELISDLKERAGLKVAELELECSTSALFSISCNQAEVWVQVGSEAARPCPFEERMSAGRYKVQARREGYQGFETEMELVAGTSIRVAIPELSKVEQAAAKARLSVSCPASLGAVILSGAAGKEELRCPFERELEPGAFTLSSADGKKSQSFELSPGAARQIDLGDWAPAADLPSVGVVVGLRLHAGTGLSSGTVYRDDLETEAGELSGGFVGTGLTFGLTPELGYALNENWMVGVQSRLELGNFSWIVGAIARFTPAIAHGLRLRVALGAGYGELLQPVVHAETDTTTWSKMGPVFATLGTGLSVHVFGPMRVVFDIEARAAFPDFAMHFDWAGLGLELVF